MVLEGEAGHQDSIVRTEYSVNTLIENGVELEKLGYAIANWNRAQAQTKTAALLTQYAGRIELIIANNDDMALGVVKALEEKGVKEKVAVVGVDFTAEAKAAIEEGTYDATVAMSPYLMGREGIIIMLKALEGQDVSEVGDSTPMAVVDATNVDQMADWR